MTIPKTILLIDDEPEIRSLMKDVLSKTAQRFYEASNGKEGFDHLGKNQIHLIILDNQMPVMDGMTFLKQLRARRFEVPCIVVTGNPTTAVKTNSVLWGAMQFLEKPLDLEYLVNATAKGLQLGHRIANADIELEKICKERQIPAGDRAQWIKQERSQYIMQLTLEAMSSAPIKKTGT